LALNINVGYPAGFKLATSNYPIAKAAFYSIKIIRKPQNINKLKNRSGIQIQKILSTNFVVDGLIIGGNSGGPILSPKDFTTINNNNHFQSLMYKSGELHYWNYFWLARWYRLDYYYSMTIIFLN